MFFQHIFEHNKGPLSGLFFITEKCRSEDKQGVLLASANFVALLASSAPLREGL